MPRFLRDLKRHARGQLRLVGKFDEATSFDSADAVHDLRVALRRLRLLLRLAETAGDDDAGSLRRGARKISRALSAIRDLDVLIARVVADGVDGSEPWLARLGAERRAAVERAKRELERERTGRWCKHLRSWCRSRSRGPVRDEILPRIFEENCAEIVREYSPATSHELRIHTKHLRYLVEFFPGATANPDSLVAQLTAVQDRLGNARDLALAAERARAEGFAAYSARLRQIADQVACEGLDLARKVTARQEATEFPSGESKANDTPSR